MRSASKKGWNQSGSVKKPDQNPVWLMRFGSTILQYYILRAGFCREIADNQKKKETLAKESKTKSVRW